MPASSSATRSLASVTALRTDLGPTGGSTVGEVEDYAGLDPQGRTGRQSGHLRSPAGLDQQHLGRCLDNDFPSSTGILTITDVTQPANGNGHHCSGCADRCSTHRTSASSAHRPRRSPTPSMTAPARRPPRRRSPSSVRPDTDRSGGRGRQFRVAPVRARTTWTCWPTT